MKILDNESYLLDLLLQRRLISAEQKKRIAQKWDQQFFPKKKQIAQRVGKRRKAGDKLDLVDIISGFHFVIPGKRKEILTDEHILQAVAKDRKLPFKKLDPLEIDLQVVTKTIPKSFALKYLLLPFALDNGVLDVALYDPANLSVLEEIERANQVTVRPYLSTKSDVRRMLAEFYGFQSSITAAENRLAGPTVDLGNLEQYVRIASTEEIASTDQHIKGAVDHMFNYAFEQRASDIHVEPKRDASLVRFRIDGALHTIYTLPKVVHPAIISRIKTLARLDIAEKRRPQDGRIKVGRQGKESEIRVSTIPVAFGEKAVLRILDSDVVFQDPADLGFSDRDFLVYQKFLQAPHGIVLVTGPTGSGKSTTLYSTLKHIATPEKNIVTVEDPVEMVHEDFNQISVQQQIGVTFSSILRNILRQDPDIIMIGEIRDSETAAHAVQAALTGHLVFSTLHTNDSVASISRLQDLGVQPFLIGSTMLGVIAQRLIRIICPHCGENHTVSISLLKGFGLPVEGEGDLELRRGKGCRECRGTGYFGRCGVFEVFPMSDAIRMMVGSLAPEADICEAAIQEGMTTLREDAWQKAKAGITTYDEALRVTGAG